MYKIQFFVGALIILGVCLCLISAFVGEIRQKSFWTKRIEKVSFSVAMFCLGAVNILIFVSSIGYLLS